MTYTHKMLPLPQQYDQAAVEKKWQAHWLATKTYAWSPATAREDSYVIDTPPPTVSGTLHMGHVFSYTQADFIARFQRMNGKNVFYPMGFDDNGLPTERLVEKTKKIRAVDMSREKFIEECLGVSEEARKEFRALFESIALSVDWDQEYHTISDDSRRLSQLSFLDLVTKGHCYRAQRPFYWDPIDQTAIASAEIEDKELPSFANEIIFKIVHSDTQNSVVTPGMSRGPAEAHMQSARVDDGAVSTTTSADNLIIMTTRPELLPACVALFCHPEDARYTALHGKEAEVPLFGFPVPILTDATVDPEKGTGLMMCCTFGDDADIAKWQKHKLPTRVVVNKRGRIDFSGLPEAVPHLQPVTPSNDGTHLPAADKVDPVIRRGDNPWARLQDLKISNTDPKHLGARQITIELLKEAGLLLSSKPITHTVKCAERSGAPLEILPTHQWFVKVTDKKPALTQKARECNWNPDWMRLRIEQWIDGLNQDWCISRQRYFGVPFPVWYAKDKSGSIHAIYAKPDQLPVNPLKDSPAGFQPVATWNPIGMTDCVAVEDIYDINGNLIFKGDGHTWIEVYADPDVMDTWATSSISPQLSAHGINAETAADANRFGKLFPADLRPQAHEIIRTWAFYTIVKAYLHADEATRDKKGEGIPWKNLMISGWCLAEDKSKMSKSKGNVVTPVALIEERGTDAVRYWAGTSRLGADTAFSPDLLKIGKKLVGKLWNATAFAAIHLSKMDSAPTTAATDSAITETLDRWILSRLQQTVVAATNAFARYEYADALDATNQFFWADFCDNYLELIKKRVYNEPVIPGLSRDLPQHAAQLASGDPGIRRDDSQFTTPAQQSAVRTLYYVLDGILKLYAPFTPHVTEELYAHIFANEYAAKGSLHAMGQWPKAGDYLLDGDALIFGSVAIQFLEFIRKAKSDAKRSIKTPVTHALAYVGPSYLSDIERLNSISDDLKGAGNIMTLEWAELTNTESGFRMDCTLAPEADAA